MDVPYSSDEKVTCQNPDADVLLTWSSHHYIADEYREQIGLKPTSLESSVALYENEGSFTYNCKAHHMSRIYVLV